MIEQLICEEEETNNLEPEEKAKDFGKRKFISLSSEKQRVQSAKDTQNNMRSQTKWVHTPESLLQGHIAYNVKFLGESEVDQPKGIEIVKDVIRKMKFNKHIKKAEGQKPPKVELTISVDGVTILDPKTKIILHQNPLHRISYCADDKSDKRMFTFIAKAADSNKHFCYVFDSEKCAKEITMTVGQAFDLAYRRFVETTGKDIDVRKQFLLLQKKVNTLQQENETLKKRIVDLENLKDKSDVDFYKSANNILNLGTVGTVSSPTAVTSNTGGMISLTSSSTSPPYNKAPTSPTDIFSPSSPTDIFSPSPVSHTVRKEAGLQANSKKQTSNGDFLNDPSHRSNSPPKPLLQPPPPGKARSASTPNPRQVTSTPPVVVNPLIADSGASSNSDPFGMGDFNPFSTLNTKSNQDIDMAINNADKELLDLQTGFSRGLCFGAEDFSLDDLDPLNQKS
ncbi:PTB domain-containing engulfment adapter protein 1 isoform X2 [Octopus sinensis]|uniref:PTB domain-containing engulfment adapter protein 1 isoform X2 n=1 Tax=Octopus sinensis TaxID=2607531 RepID=A0A6P7TA56_9MOLL|nr:PTB domain-containing engulfment adapter protein 1 isoform X2 [Octopus sinensis]